jgi:Zn-dependent protease
MALQLGDSTAQDMGRLTLNPLAHIDPFGTVVLPIILLLTSGIFIGYAKPVPFDPRNLKNPRRDSALIGIAGPAANLLIATALGMVVRFGSDVAFLAIISQYLKFIIMINIWLALFNLIPVPPLDGSKVLLGITSKFDRTYQALEGMGMFSLFVALFLAMVIIPSLAYPLFSLIIGQPFVFF